MFDAKQSLIDTITQRIATMRTDVADPETPAFHVPFLEKCIERAQAEIAELQSSALTPVVDQTIIDNAYQAGLTLDPNDPSAVWIDKLTGATKRAAIDAYHQGQAEQFETFDEDIDWE